MYSGCFTLLIRCYSSAVLLRGMPHIPAFSIAVQRSLCGFFIMTYHVTRWRIVLPLKSQQIEMAEDGRQ